MSANVNLHGEVGVIIELYDCCMQPMHISVVKIKECQTQLEDAVFSLMLGGARRCDAIAMPTPYYIESM